MCGIAGILKFDPRTAAEGPRLHRMSRVLTHRGPDGDGVMLDGSIGLAHRRLAIIDLAAGAQPMSNEDSSIWIVFNGEIYNHSMLRRQLEARGHTYRTRCDTETILHLYEDEGDRAPEFLRGMFAFAIWDAPKRRLLLARDRLGIKPLYVACGDTELLFGSEIKAILAALPGRAAVNDVALPSFLATGFPAGEHTLFRGITRLLPGHTLTWSLEEGIQRRRYFQLPASARVPAEAFRDEAAALRGRLTHAVQRHLMSDVPLGVFLSGGIDSSALAAIVAGLVRAPIQTFAVGFADPEANELAYAKQAAAAIRSQHRDLVVTPQQFFAALPQLIWHEDEPIAFPSSVPLYFLARMAGEHVKVVLTGEGADELFLGYNRYRVTHWNARLGRAYWTLTPRSIRAGIQQLVRHAGGRVGRIGRRSFLALDPNLSQLYLDNFAVLRESDRRRLVARPELRDADVYAEPLERLTNGGADLLDRMGRLDLETYLHELLMKQDQMSMAASIESRVPFLDDQLVEHVITLPSSYKVRGWQTKAVLRAAVADLVPPAILTRRKMGFPVPVGAWLRHGFQSLVDEFVVGSRAVARGLFDPAALRQLAREHASGEARHGDRLWLLMNLEIWHRIYQDGESPEHVMRAAPASGMRAA
jgi:asparagine synthase (glutamine-hydrolysing)